MRQLLRDGSIPGFAARHRAAVGFLIFVVVVASLLAFLAHQQAQNRRAIRVSCVLLDNAIVQANADPSAPLLIGEIVRLAVEHRHRVFVVRFREVSAHPHTLQSLNCARIARNPDSVRALPAAPVVMPPPVVYGGHG